MTTAPPDRPGTAPGTRRRSRGQPGGAGAPAPGATRREAEILADLRALCATPGFAHIVAFLSLRDNFIFFSGDMTTAAMANIYSAERLIRTEMSLLIGYMAKAGAAAFAAPPEAPQALFERTHALLVELHQSLVVPMVVDRPGETGGVVVAERGAEALREPIFYGGESAFNFQYVDFAVPKYAQDSEWLIATRGFDLGMAAQVVAALEALLPEKARAAIEAIREAKGAAWSVLPGFLFTVGEVAAHVDLPEVTVRAVLEAFALPRDDLNKGFEALNDFNAAVASPLLPVGVDEYALLQWYPVVEALYEAPFYWMGADKAYKSKAFTHRGAFTEDFAYQRLCAVFGAAHVHRNVNLDKGKVRVGEIDVLVAWAGRAIVVQAKSKRLTIAARQGNEVFLRDDFKGAVQDAYDQALLCAEALYDPAVRLTTADGDSIALGDPITQIFPLCLASDHYPALVIQVDRFLVKRTLDRVAAALITDIFALDAVSEMLGSPLRFLNYLELRAAFGEKLLYAHEMTLLGYHLKGNLWIEDDHDLVMLHDDIAGDLEIAMQARRRGAPGETTPKGILTMFAGSPFERVLARIEERPTPSMVDVGLFLRQIGSDTIKAFNTQVSRIIARTRADGRVHDISMEIGSAGITLHCSRAWVHQAARALQDHCARRKYAAKADVWYGIFLSPGDGLPVFAQTLDYPWTHDARLEAELATMNRGRPGPAAPRPLFAGAGVGRNAPCPCGSGRKFKKCCLDK